MSKADTLALPARVDATAVASLWQACERAPPGTIDFGAVQEIDSAGLAFVAALCGVAGPRRGSSRPALVNVPERFEQLCRAHRVEKELLS